MPRSSRHRSHRSRKHSWDRSVSEDEEDVPRDKRSREEEPAASSSVRVSRDPDSEKRISLRTPEGKDAGGLSNGDALLEHGKKRKERVEDAADNDRWNGGEEEDYKRTKVEDNSGLDKNSKSKHVAVDLKGRSNRRQESSNDRNDDNVGKSEPGRRKAEDSSRRNSSSGLPKDVKEDRERGSARDRERVSERDRERISVRDKERERERSSEREKYGVSDKERERTSQKERNRERESHDVVYETSDYFLNKKRGSKVESNEEERMSRKDVKVNELQVQDLVPNTELEKGVNKHRRDGSEDDKLLHDVRDGDEKRLSSKDDHHRHRSYRDERHEDGKHRDKKLDDVDKDHRHRDDKRRDARPGDRASERTENKSFRDDVKIMESRYRKTKQDNDNDYDGVPSVDDRNIKSKDYRGRNRFSDEFEDYNEFKPRNGKEQQEDADKIFPPGRTDSQMDKSRSDYRNSDKLESSLRNNRQKITSSSNAYPIRDHGRDSIKQMESAWKEPSSEDRSRPSASRSTSSGVHERVSFTRSDKIKLKADMHSAEIYVETAASTKFERGPTSDVHVSPNQRRERSSSISDRRFSDRSGTRRSYDTEGGQKNMNLKDRDRMEKAVLDDSSHSDPCNRESTPAGSSINRSGHFTGNSPSHLLPPATRVGSDSPSVLGSYEDERCQVGDRKSYNRYKRTGEHAFGRGHLNAWNITPSWQSPLGNGFIPLQHGVPPAGFHPPVAQFPGPSLFGVRPPLDLAHGGVSYHMHDVADSFHGHGRPFGWHNGRDQSCPPHMQLWDGSNAVFGDEQNMYGRLDWDHNRHLLSSRGWEMNAELWKSQNGSMNVDFPTPKKEQECSVDPLADETQITQHCHQTQSEKSQPHLECPPTEGNEAKNSRVSPHGNNISEGPQKLQSIKSSEISKLSGNRSVNFIANYLSRIDISPFLADSDLYEKCKSLCAPSVTAHRHLQNDGDVSSRKMNASSKILSSFFMTTKESTFQSAISLYKKQNESSKVKLHIPIICSGEKKEPSEDSGKGEDGQVGKENKFFGKAPLPDDADTTCNMETEDVATVYIPDDAATTSNMETEDVATFNNPDDVGTTSNMEAEDVATINNSDDAGTTSNMEAEDVSTINTHADCLPVEADDKRPNFCSGAVICANDPQACDSPTEEIRVNLSRIPNSPESTH